MKDLRRYGTWALITGASSGLGREFARLIASHGVNCVLVDIDGDGLAELSEELATLHGVDCQCVQQDLTAEDFLRRIEEATDSVPIGILVNNAGAGCGGEFATRDPKRLEGVVRLSCLALVKLTRTFLPKMLERKAGAIVMVASLQSFISSPYEATYCGAKAFTLHFGESLWGELRKTPVDIITVCPAGMKTDFYRAEGFTEQECRRMWSVSSGPAVIASLTLKHLGKKPMIAPRVAGAVGFLMRWIPRKWSIYLVESFTKRLVCYERM